jgi:hypothetical protein
MRTLRYEIQGMLITVQFEIICVYVSSIKTKI